MQNPSSTTSTELLHKIGIYHWSMLTANDETLEIGDSFQVVQAKLDQKYAIRILLNDTVTKLFAKRNYADLLLDRIVNKVESVILADVNKNRDSPIYKKLFPKGLRGITNAPYEEEVQQVERFEQVLRETKPEIAEIYGAKLQQARERSNQSIIDLKKAISDEGIAFADEKIARLDWLTQYKKNYGVLIAMFPDDKALVEEFFMNFRGSGSAGSGDSGGGETTPTTET
jgi:hypothetical protein